MYWGQLVEGQRKHCHKNRYGCMATSGCCGCVLVLPAWDAHIAWQLRFTVKLSKTVIWNKLFSTFGWQLLKMEMVTGYFAIIIAVINENSYWTVTLLSNDIITTTAACLQIFVMGTVVTMKVVHWHGQMFPLGASGWMRQGATWWPDVQKGHLASGSLVLHDPVGHRG